MPTVTAGVNADIVISLHANETITGERTLGFLLAKGERGQPLYSVVDDAARSLIQQVSNEGYSIDPETLEIVFKKEAWDGPAGVYEDKPGSRSPAFGVNVNFLRPKPTIGPRAYSIGRPSLTATTISFTATDTISDSGNSLARFRVGDTISITGTTNNNLSNQVIVTSAAGTLTIASGVTTEAAGASVTITARAFNGPIKSAAVLTVSSSPRLFIVTSDGAGPTSYIYRLANWSITDPASAYWEYADDSGDWTTPSGTPEQLFVHSGTMYLARGTAGYAYTTDGDTWTQSTRSGNDALAHRFYTVNGFLNKILKAATHNAMASKSDTGVNGGTAWPSANQIGDTTNNIMEAMALGSSLVFCKEDGIHTMDSGGNIRQLLDLISLYQANNGYGAAVWHPHEMVMYPIVSGHLWALRGGQPTMITPSLQQEKPMEVLASEQSNFSARPYFTLSTPQYAYATQDFGNMVRVMVLEETSAGMYWRTFVEGSTLQAADYLFFTTGPTSGPVLWSISSSTDVYKPTCWPLWVGSDPLQDSNARFASSSVIYEPWLTMGCPETDKRWAWLELMVTEKTVNSGAVTFQVDAYTEDGDQIITAQTVTFASTGLTRRAIAFTNTDVSKIVSRRMRLVFTLGNTSASHTPILVSYRVHAYAMPTMRNRLEMTLLTPTGSVTHGLADQAVARTFFKEMRTATLPITLTDMFGTAYTVIPPTTAHEVAIKEEGGGWSTAWQLIMAENITS